MRRVVSLSPACGVWVLALAMSATGASSLHIDLRGFGQSLGATTACPDGRTSIRIAHSPRRVLDCVVSARKLTKPGLDPWRIIETVRAETGLPGGTLHTTEIQTSTFTRSGTSVATIRGRVTGGTGRYSGASGTVSGGGTGRNGAPLWHVTFDLP